MAFRISRRSLFRGRPMVSDSNLLMMGSRVSHSSSVKSLGYLTTDRILSSVLVNSEITLHETTKSHNSSRSPSSDSPFTKPSSRSRCQPSGHKPGGRQPGRRGVPRSLADVSDQCVIIPLTGTCAGGRGCTQIATTVLTERRQVVAVVIPVSYTHLTLPTKRIV